MKSLFKWLFIGLLLLLLVPLIIGVAVSTFIDPNSFKPQIIALVENNTRGELSIDGELDWSFFPSIGVDLNDVGFRLPEDKKEAFADLESVKLSVKVLPLLSGKVQANGIIVDGLKLNLDTDENGINNWDRIFPENSGADNAAPAAGNSGNDSSDNASDNATGSDAETTPLALDIASVAISDSGITYIDRKAVQAYQFTNVNFNSSNINVDGKAYPLDMQFDINLLDPKLSTTANIKSQISSNLDAGQFSFTDMSADLLLSGPTFADKKVNLNINTSGAMDTKAQTLKLETLDIDLANVLRAAVQLDASNLDSKPVLKGGVNVNSFNLNKVLSALGQEAMVFNAANATDSVALNGTISGPANSFMLSPLTIQLDNTTLKGQLGISNLETSQYVIKLKGDKINVDDYSAPEDPNAAADTSQPNAALLPIATLQPLLFNAELGFDALQASGVKMRDLKVKATGNKGLIKLKAMDAKLYEGTLATRGQIDTRKDTPSLNLTTLLGNINVGSFLTDFAEVSQLSGKGNIAADVKLRGNSKTEWMNGLNGAINFNMKEAAIAGFNADKLACDAIAQVRQKQQTKTDWAETTNFTDISGGLVFTDGVAKNDNLKVALENMDISGNGTLNLKTDEIDYRIGMRLNGDMSEQGEACTVNERYRDIAWPMRCRGKISDDPKKLCGVDSSGLKDIAKGEIKREAKRKLLEKIVGKKDPATDGAEGEADPKDALKKKLLEKLF